MNLSKSTIQVSGLRRSIFFLSNCGKNARSKAVGMIQWMKGSIRFKSS